MRKDIVYVNIFDSDANPAGGHASGTGLWIQWQNGPLGRGDQRLEPNGAFVEDVIELCVERLKFYQDSKFVCMENDGAIDHLKRALQYLKDRTISREKRGVEGTCDL